MVYAISQERNLLIDNEVQRILQASMDKGEIAKMNVKDTSYLLQASVLVHDFVNFCELGHATSSC